MKSGIVAILLISSCIVLGAPAFADDDIDPKLAQQLAQFKKNCEQHQAQEKEKAQKIAQAVESLPPQQKQEVKQELQRLNAAIAATDKMLAEPMPATRSEQEAYLKRASGAVAATREYESAVSKDAGIAPTSHMEQVLSRLGEADDFKTKFGAFDRQPTVKDSELNAPVPVGGNSNFFGVSGQMPPSTVTPPQTSSSYAPTTVDAATSISDHDHGVGGGVMLEGDAGGLGAVSSVDYDSATNALTLNGDLVYFVKIPPWTFATMCRQIGTDRNALLGVSETGTDGLVFGDKPEIYKDSDLAYEMMLADKFLGDIIFARRNGWTQGYKFPGSAPEGARVKSSMLVRFSFGNFQFATNDGQLALTSSSLEVRMMPTSKAPSPTGQLLPDYNAMDKGWTPPDAFVANARILTDNADYFRHEAVIQEVFADGETAALLRSLKESGQDLNALADKIDGGDAG